MNRRNNDTFEHHVYLKSTHTDFYSQKDLNHHPAQKLSIHKFPVYRTRPINETNHLSEEPKHLAHTSVQK